MASVIHAPPGHLAGRHVAGEARACCGRIGALASRALAWSAGKRGRVLVGRPRSGRLGSEPADGARRALLAQCTHMAAMQGGVARANTQTRHSPAYQAPKIARSASASAAVPAPLSGKVPGARQVPCCRPSRRWVQGPPPRLAPVGSGATAGACCSPQGQRGDGQLRFAREGDDDGTRPIGGARPPRGLGESPSWGKPGGGPRRKVGLTRNAGRRRVRSNDTWAEHEVRSGCPSTEAAARARHLARGGRRAATRGVEARLSGRRKTSGLPCRRGAFLFFGALPSVRRCRVPRTACTHAGVGTAVVVQAAAHVQVLAPVMATQAAREQAPVSDAGAGGREAAAMEPSRLTRVQVRPLVATTGPTHAQPPR